MTPLILHMLRLCACLAVLDLGLVLIVRSFL